MFMSSINRNGDKNKLNNFIQIKFYKVFDAPMLEILFLF
jgi:hypothetical protein